MQRGLGGGLRRIRTWCTELARLLTLLLVFGASSAHAGGLSTLLTDLYGGDGILLATPPSGFNHSPHFSASSLDDLNSLSEELTSALGFFAFNSTVSSYTFDLERGVPVRTTDSLGPILSERATTLGARRLNVGFSYNRIDFKRFEGDDLDDITLFFDHDDINNDGILGPPGCDCAELDKVRVDLDIELAQDVYSIYGTFGVLKNLDIGVAIPLLHVDLKASASAEVDRRHTNSTIVHNFADPPVPPEDFKTSSVKGSATGIGDVLLRGKYNFLRGEEWMPNLAFLGQVKFPTGDEDDLLGTGDWRGMPMLIADKTYGRVSPHVNLGFEIVGGKSDLNNLKYFIGADVRLHERATTVIDLLGRWEPSGDGVGDNLLDIAIGGKFNVYRSLVLVTNFIVPLNRNQGLRPDFIWALGFEYTFGGGG